MSPPTMAHHCCRLAQRAVQRFTPAASHSHRQLTAPTITAAACRSYSTTTSPSQLSSLLNKVTGGSNTTTTQQSNSNPVNDVTTPNHSLSAPQSEAERAVNNLLYNIPSTGSAPSRRVLSILVANENGVLSRVSGILAGRGFNIESLVVSATEVPILSRMTVVLDGNSSQVEQARRQLEDLPQIWAAVEFPTHLPVVERELVLAKVSTKPETLNTSGSRNSKLAQLMGGSDIRRAVQDLTQLFGGKVVDITPSHVMVELTAKCSRIDAFVGLLRPFGIIELARTGALTVARGQLDASSQYEQLVSDDSGAGKARLNPKKSTMVDEAFLPPG